MLKSNLSNILSFASFFAGTALSVIALVLSVLPDGTIKRLIEKLGKEVVNTIVHIYDDFDPVKAATYALDTPMGVAFREHSYDFKLTDFTEYNGGKTDIYGLKYLKGKISTFKGYSTSDNRSDIKKAVVSELVSMINQINEDN